MINFNKNKLINKTLDNYYKTFHHTLDTEDFVEPKINKMISKYICKNLKRHFRKIDKEDRIYQQGLKKQQKLLEKQNKQANKKDKPNKILLFWKGLFKKRIVKDKGTDK